VGLPRELGVQVVKQLLLLLLLQRKTLSLLLLVVLVLLLLHMLSMGLCQQLHQMNAGYAPGAWRTAGGT